jgi:hypothetical protein
VSEPIITNRTATTAGLLLLGALLLARAGAARCQEIEPRAYSNAPVGVNFLIAGYVYTQGSLPFDSALPVKHASIDTSNAVVAYARVLELWGQSAKFDANVPYTWLSGTAEAFGEPLSRTVAGPANAAFRLSVNLHGAPALPMREFAGYRQDLIVGASLQVTAPTGQYDDTRVVNIGTNRWSFKPEVGVSKAIGPWYLEAATAATFFTDNGDFYGGHERAQEPVYSLQGHAIRAFAHGIWASVDATWFTGGRTSLDGVAGNDLQRNWRLGATLAVPLDARSSVKIYGSRGVSARTGNDYDLLGIGWQYRWGGGIP